jgi:hypothetical protein
VIQSGEYLVLSHDNLEECRELTSLPEDELKALYEECTNFAKVQVFYRQGDQWSGFQVSQEFQHHGMLDDTIKEVIEKYLKEHDEPDADRL